MEKLNDTIEEIKVEWIRPRVEHEKGEIERVIKDFLGEEPTEESIKRVMDIIENSPLVELSEEDWGSLQNTDSFDIRMGHLEDAKNMLDEHEKETPVELRRNFDKHLDRFNNGTPMEAPAILKNKEGILHLISGNTRLMIARALGVRPKVVIAEIK